MVVSHFSVYPGVNWHRFETSLSWKKLSLGLLMGLSHLFVCLPMAVILISYQGQFIPWYPRSGHHMSSFPKKLWKLWQMAHVWMIIMMIYLLKWWWCSMAAPKNIPKNVPIVDPLRWPQWSAAGCPFRVPWPSLLLQVALVAVKHRGVPNLCLTNGKTWKRLKTNK